MTKRQDRQYEMLVRVRDFGKLHQDGFPEGGEGSKAFAAVAGVVEEVHAFTGDLQTARRVARESKRQAKRGLSAQIAAIAGSARVMAKTTPDFDAKFPLPAGASDVAVLQAGQLFLTEAVAVKDAFVRCGLAPAFIDDLQQAVTAFEQAIAGKHGGKTRSKVSRVAVRAALKAGMSAVDSLDVLVANAFGGDIKTMEVWKSTRRVERVVRGTVAVPPVTSPQSDNPPASSADAPPDAPASTAA